MPERYMIILLNNIWNFDRLLAVKVHQDYFLLRLRRIKYLRYENTINKCLQKVRCGTIQGCGTIKLFPEAKMKPFE